jgi:hypothetical protein
MTRPVSASFPNKGIPAVTVDPPGRTFRQIVLLERRRGQGCDERLMKQTAEKRCDSIETKKTRPELQ